MDIGWLRDFVALAEHANFSRAAESRNVTQPAFSRRIKGLEHWVGAELFHRGPQGVALTKAGAQFHHGADELIRRLDQLRTDARTAAGKDATVIRFAATHALSFSFFPQWMNSAAATPPLGPVELISDSLEACEGIMLRGEAQFLLCHHHPDAASRFDQSEFISARVGTEKLVALAAPDSTGKPMWTLPGVKSRPLPHLGYRSESGLGRIIAARRVKDRRALFLDTVFTAQLAAALMSMALDGRGIAWLPLGLAAPYVASGALVKAGDESWDIEVDIRLFRPAVKLNPAAEQFWRGIAG